MITNGPSCRCLIINIKKIHFTYFSIIILKHKIYILHTINLYIMIYLIHKKNQKIILFLKTKLFTSKS